ncbi:MAG: 1,6-anhydro-N-acetylmuramyl-L-alanine amidase AmpD [Gammaproteobacteria bacterium]|nr:MAG: 1,6-anhydro-N-acetylmuramyl-L-alanine amidase AmpD [Gammaproteobacteria bacterium]
MKVNNSDGLIEGIPFIGSPNFDDRPGNCVPEALIIHAISLPPGEFGDQYIEQLFSNCLDPDEHPCFEEIKDLKVSAHVLIRRTGEMVQFVRLDKRAWHAGESECEGRSCVNDFSIGIELEGCDDQPFEDAQYESLVRLSKSVIEAYPAINNKRIYGHSDISPGRKTDPGPHFDWPRYRRALG